jgi:hypothetical protein
VRLLAGSSKIFWIFCHASTPYWLSPYESSHGTLQVPESWEKVMDVIEVIKQSARLAWDRKAWWVFGLFVAASGSGGAGSGGGYGSGGGETGMPVWLIAVLVVAK